MTLDNISASTVEAVLSTRLSEALRPGTEPSDSVLGFVLRPPTPQKPLDQVLGQLAAEPPPHRLDLNIAYSSPAAFAADSTSSSPLLVNLYFFKYTHRGLRPPAQSRAFTSREGSIG